MRSPGIAVPAAIYRTPRSGSGYVKVFDITLREFMGVLWQADRQTTFEEQQGGAVRKRMLVIADVPRTADPVPVHGGDQLRVPIQAVGGVILATPPPQHVGSYTVVTLPPGVASQMIRSQPAVADGMDAIVQDIVGDQLHLIAPGDRGHLPTVPRIGQSVIQSYYALAVDDCDPTGKHHLTIYVLQNQDNV